MRARHRRRDRARAARRRAPRSRRSSWPRWASAIARALDELVGYRPRRARRSALRAAARASACSATARVAPIGRPSDPRPEESTHERRTSDIKRVGMLFSGGPAPAANAVISAAALSFLNAGIEVIGFLDGYEDLERFSPDKPLVEGRDYLCLTRDDVSGIRNAQGHHPAHLAGESRQAGQRARRPRRPREEREAARGLRGARGTTRSTRWSPSAATTRSRPPTTCTACRSVVPGLRPDRGRAPAEDDRQRLLRHRLDLRLHLGRALRREGDPQHRRRRAVDQGLVRARDHGPQGRLADLRRGHRRRGHPHDLGRGLRRRASTSRRSPRRSST